LVGKSERKRPLRKQKLTWLDNIKRDLREIGWGGTDWINLAQDWGQWWPIVNTVINLRVQQTNVECKT
jgi:hypothetical protein